MATKTAPVTTGDKVSAARDLRPFRDVLIPSGTPGRVLAMGGGLLSARTLQVEFLLTANLRITVSGLRPKDLTAAA